MIFADPTHMPPAQPRARFTCDRCEEGFDDLMRFDGEYLCDPCIRVGMCKVCRGRTAIRGSDECAVCGEVEA